MRRGLALAVLLLSACAPPALVKRSLWPAPPPSGPAEFHLILQWKEPSTLEAKTLRPEPLAEAVAAEAQARGLGSLRSYQVVESAEDLAASLALWRSTHPVLRLSVEAASTRASTETAVSLSGAARYQALPFDTSVKRSALKAGVQAPWGADSGKSEEERRDWARSEAPRLYRALAAALFKELPLVPAESELFLRRGEGPRMEQAFQAAQAGDWTKARELWERQAAASPDDDAAAANLSLACEMLGDLECAASWEGRRRKSFFSADPGRLDELRGLLALRAPWAGSPLRPDAEVAVLPFDNETPDLQAPEQVRKSVFDALRAAGYAPLPLEPLDERLREAGFTDGGQLKALTRPKLARIAGCPLLLTGTVEEFRVVPLGVYFRWEVRASLGLADGPRNLVLYEKTAGALREETASGSSAAGKLAAELVGLLLKKSAGRNLAEESAEAAARFLRAWPHFVSR